MVVVTDFINNTIIYFGGAASIIAIMSIISAYNQYCIRKILQRIEKQWMMT